MTSTHVRAEFVSQMGEEFDIDALLADQQKIVNSKSFDFFHLHEVEWGSYSSLCEVAYVFTVYVLLVRVLVHTSKKGSAFNP